MKLLRMKLYFDWPSSMVPGGGRPGRHSRLADRHSRHIDTHVWQIDTHVWQIDTHVWQIDTHVWQITIRVSDRCPLTPRAERACPRLPARGPPPATALPATALPATALHVPLPRALHAGVRPARRARSVERVHARRRRRAAHRLRAGALRCPARRPAQGAAGSDSLVEHLVHEAREHLWERGRRTPRAG
jgi:hypothetical protein